MTASHKFVRKKRPDNMKNHDVRLFCVEINTRLSYAENKYTTKIQLH